MKWGHQKGLARPAPEEPNLEDIGGAGHMTSHLNQGENEKSTVAYHKGWCGSSYSRRAGLGDEKCCQNNFPRFGGRFRTQLAASYIAARDDDDAHDDGAGSREHTSDRDQNQEASKKIKMRRRTRRSRSGALKKK